MAQAVETLPDDPNELKAMLLAERARNDRLVQIIKEMQRHRFGRRAETLPEDQMLLALEEVEQTEAGAAAEEEAKSATEREKASRKRRTNRGALPAHLPRIETIVDIEDKACPCCKGALHQIGEDVSERLDVVPAQFRVLVTRRPKYACRACEGAIVQASAPARLIEGGLPTEATIAHTGLQIRRSLAALSPSTDLRPAGDRPRPFDARRLGWPRRLAFAARARAASGTHQIVDKNLRRRDKGAGA